MIFSDPNPPTTTEAIHAFELELEKVLPESYKAFLLRYNGGRPASSHNYAVIPGWDELLVSEIFGMGAPSWASLKTRDTTNFSTSVGRHMLTIADTPNGDQIIMDLRPKAYGEIYVRAHDSPPNDPFVIDDTGFDQFDYEEASLYYPIADSFERFIDMLGPEPD